MLNIIKYYRLLLITYIALEIIWSLVTNRFAPNLPSTVHYFRFFSTSLFIVILLLSYAHKWVKIHLKHIMYYTMFAWTIISLLEIATTQYHYIFLLRSFIVLPLIIQVFRERNWLNSYIVFYLLIALIGSYYIQLEVNFEVVYIAGYCTFSIALGYIANLNIMLYNKYLNSCKTLAAMDGKIEEYAHYNSHVLRSPVARLLGLLHLIGIEPNPDDLMDKVNHEALELDKIIREAQRVLE